MKGFDNCRIYFAIAQGTLPSTKFTSKIGVWLTYLHLSRWRSETDWNIGTPMGKL